MTATCKQTLVDTLLAEGKAEGKAEMLLRVLASREIEVPAKTRDLVTACSDTSQLEAWFDLALDAETLSDVFGNQP